MSLENITLNISKIETLIKQTNSKVDECILVDIRTLISETTQLLKNEDLPYNINIRKVIIVKMQDIVVQFHEILTKCKDRETRCAKRDLKIKFPNLSQDEINRIIDDTM